MGINTSHTPGAGRIHLPVAAKAILRRRFGEPNTPGRAIRPQDAAQWLDTTLSALAAAGMAVTMVGVHGPGDPLAEPQVALDTLRLVRSRHPELALTLATNGLCAAGFDEAELATSLAQIGLSHVTIFMDAADEAMIQRLYAWIRPGRRTLPPDQAARELLEGQARTMGALVAAGLLVKVNMTVYPGINEDHVTAVAARARQLGAGLFALSPFQPVDPANEPLPPTDERMAELRELASRHIQVVPGPQTCGHSLAGMEPCPSPAAVGLPPLPPMEGQAATPSPRPQDGQTNVAVASSNGLEVDLHLGQAVRFLIFGPRPADGLPSLLGVRDAPEPGGGGARWLALAETLKDCFAVLAASAGRSPTQALADRGIAVLPGEREIKGAVDALLGGGKGKGRKPARSVS